jgi:hypothetical protein
MSSDLLSTLANLSQSQSSFEATVEALVLGTTLTVTSLGYYSETPSEKGSGIVPAKLYGKMPDGRLVRLQNEDADLWAEGLKEAMVELGFKDGVLWREGELVESRFKGASWIFEIEPEYVGKTVKHHIWDDGDAYELHGGMLAGPVTVRIRTHKPPKRAVYEEIHLGRDDA